MFSARVLGGRLVQFGDFRGQKVGLQIPDGRALVEILARHRQKLVVRDADT